MSHECGEVKLCFLEDEKLDLQSLKLLIKSDPQNLSFLKI